MEKCNVCVDVSEELIKDAVKGARLLYTLRATLDENCSYFFL